MKKSFMLIFILTFWGCVKIPQGVEPVKDFEADRYLGKWYEIARLDHSFEHGLASVTAEYSLNKDGSIHVVNRGYDKKSGKWKEAVGKAFFVKGNKTGFLKVSFFGPFYGAYVIFGLDNDAYQYSFVCGPDRDYLWLLSRTPDISSETKKRFIDEASRLGFDTRKLIYVEQQ
jgi:apolipoprotein D and lipocalin family protein